MTSHPLTLRPWQITALQQNRLRMVALPLRPQPNGTPELYQPVSDEDAYWATFDEMENETRLRLPFSPGDTLWVREGWQLWPEFDGYKPSEVGPPDKGDDLAVLYTADRPHGPLWDARKRSPVTMPRWASRYTLTAGPQTVKRLQEVTEEEARDAGLRGNASGPWGCEGLMQDFEEQWSADHGPGAWDANPVCLFASVEEQPNG